MQDLTPAGNPSAVITPAQAHGRILWHDLQTPDPDKATDFYGKVLGWTYETSGQGDHAYHHIHDGQSQTGGIMKLDSSHDVPAHWLAYVGVTDLEASVEQVTQLGGKLVVGPMPIPGTGRFAIVQDPFGATFALLVLEQYTPERQGFPLPGQFCWYTILTPDINASLEFYSAIFGWTAQTMEMAPGVSQAIMVRGQEQIADVSPTDAHTPPCWLLSVVARDLDKDFAHAMSLGAQALMPPSPLGNFGRLAIVNDPTGATLCFFAGNSPDAQS